MSLEKSNPTCKASSQLLLFKSNINSKLKANTEWNTRVLLVSSELLAGLYSRARPIRGRGLFLSTSQLTL